MTDNISTLNGVDAVDISNSNILLDWQTMSAKLSKHATENLVHRIDCYGTYIIKDDGTKEQITSKFSPSPQVLHCHFQCIDHSKVMGLHPITKDNQTKWGAIDIDNHSGGDSTTWDKALRISNRMKQDGLSPIIEDSDGKGGFHVWTLFDKLYPTSAVYSYLQSICDDAETFPKQAKIKDDDGYGNWLRLPGLHHKRKHISQFWNGDKWLDGAEGITLWLATKAGALPLIENKAPNVQDIETDALNGECDPLPSKVEGEVNTLPMPSINVPHSERQKLRAHLKIRTREYLKTSEPAGSRDSTDPSDSDGHTFRLAGHLLAMDCGGERMTVGDVMDAMMSEWNGRCSPPWDRAGLETKVKSAASNGTPREVKPCKVCGAETIGSGDRVVGAPSSSTPKTYPPSNLGNGQLFADTYRHDLMYVSEWKRWLHWNGKRWEAVTPELIRRYAHRLVLDVMPTIAKAISLDDERAKYYKHIAVSHQTYAMDAMLKEATAYISVSASTLDADPMLFNLKNGTLDCQTGEVRPHRREDLITKISPCSFDPNATAPTWERFINRIMVDANQQADTTLVQYLQTAMGYSMTGSVREECMLVLYGNGANGKSTLLETMLYCLGDYGQAMQPSVLLADSRQGGNSDDVARLCGVRAAVAVETKDGGGLNCERVKKITGGDRIAACRKYEHPFEFQPTHKVWLATNHEPRVDGGDEGIWRRLKKVPFLASLTDAEKDTTLKGRDGKLVAEADGIMIWMIAGLKSWLVNGLIEPNAVKNATAKYRADSDVFGQFLSECCIMAKDAHCRPMDLFKAYTAWADDMGIDNKMTAVTMARKMQERGINTAGRDSKGKVYRGVGVQDHSPTNQDASFNVGV